jgi:hypothetical protein
MRSKLLRRTMDPLELNFLVALALLTFGCALVVVFQ